MRSIEPVWAVRAAALAFAVLAVGLAAVKFDREDGRDAGIAKIVAVAPDQGATALSAELARCRKLAAPEQVDEACRRAWGERRARFFGQQEGRP